MPLTNLGGDVVIFTEDRRLERALVRIVGATRILALHAHRFHVDGDQLASLPQMAYTMNQCKL